MPTSDDRPTKRARNRAQTIHDITSVALSQLEKEGASGLSLRSVARELGMSVAGLYRYFDTRDALLVRLIEDGFSDLGTTLRTVESGDPADLLRRRLHLYRRWALERPRVFNLLYTDPIPGFVAPPNGPTDVAVKGALSALLEPAAVILGVNPARPSRFAVSAMVETWSTTHGFVALEVFNHLRWTNLDLDRAYNGIVELALERLRSSTVRRRTGGPA